MANIYKAGGDVAGALAKLATKLFQEGKTSNEIRETLAAKVPGATSADIEKAVTPTLQSKVERGKELMVVEPGVARPVRPEPSTETALVPTGRPAQTTFIAGPAGVSAGEKATPQPRTIEERIRQAKQPEEDVALPATETPGLTKTQKAGIGLAAAGGAGMVGRGLVPEDEDKSVPGTRLSPKITGETYKDIKFEPSTQEVQAAVDKGGYASTRALWDRYDKLNVEFQKSVSEGGVEYADPKKAAALFIQSKQPFTGPPRGAAGKPAVEEKVSAEAEEMTKEKQGELAPPSGGDVSKPSQTLKKPTAAEPQSQRQIALSTQVDVNTFQNKLASGQPITRADLLAITSKMEELKPNEVTTDQSLIQKIEAAKDEARRAYQEEANRNQWAEVAQTLGNAIATFVAARQGVADRPLTLPQIDYGARTGQALRAYQTELASAGEQARTLERETERKQSAEDRKVALQQRQYERLLALGENAIAAQERKAERNQDLATRLEIAQLRNEKDRQVQEAKNQKAAIQAKQQGEDKLSKFLASDIKRTNQEILRLNKQLESANVVAAAKDNKDFEKALPDYMTASGIDINTPEFQKKGWFGGVSPDQDKIKASAKAAAARILQQVKELQAKKASSEQELQGLKPGAVSAPAQEPAARPARQEPAGGGMVDMIAPDGGKLKVPAEKVAELEASGAVRAK